MAVDDKAKWAVISGVGAFIAAQIVPVFTILTDKTPQDIAAKWNVWWPLIAYVLPFAIGLVAIIVLAVVAAVSYGKGKRDGIEISRQPTAAAEFASFASSQSTEGLISPPVVIDLSPLTATVPADPWTSSSGISLKDLKYSIREVITALCETGTCRDSAVQENILRLEAEHPAWHVEGPYSFKVRFIKAARDAHAARTEGGNAAIWVTGDYPPEIRKKHIGKVVTLGNLLRDQLNKLSNVNALA